MINQYSNNWWRVKSLKIYLDSSVIKDYDRCNHPAYHEDCVCCMYQFQLLNATQIKQDGLESTIKKMKESGAFEL